MPNWPGDDEVFPVATDLITHWEGLYLSPYRDSAGIPTIGWGTIAYPNGQRVAMTDPAITKAFAQQCLEFEMHEKSTTLQGYLERESTIHQAAAMLSLAYNIGTGAFSTSTVLVEFNAGNIEHAAAAFLLWDKAHVNGQLVVVPGLLNRRKAEQTIFLMPDS